MLTIGSPAPHWSLPDQQGITRNLTDYTGKYLLLFFYPKDDTPGCTTETCTIRDNYAQFTGLGIAIVGISADGVDSHKKFSEKYALPFTLLADTDKTVIKAYGADGFPFDKRISYIIDPTGTIIKTYPKVTPADHAAEILADLSQFLSATS
jgi:peroxiredoxin Q/BCP